MKKLFYSIMLLALVGVFSACKEEKEEPKETPKPDPTYSVTFWTNDCDDIVVNLYNDEDYDKEKTITEKYSSTPDCGSKGCANFSDLKKGEYYYYAYNDDYWWEGDIDVTETCETIKLSTSNGESFVKYGDVTFWTDDDDAIQYIEVNMWKVGNVGQYDEYRTITSYYGGYDPDCGAEGCANFLDVEYGEYAFMAYNDYYEWYGYITVDVGCELMMLNVSDAKTRENAQPTNAAKIQPALELSNK